MENGYNKRTLGAGTMGTNDIRGSYGIYKDVHGRAILGTSVADRDTPEFGTHESCSSLREQYSEAIFPQYVSDEGTLSNRYSQYWQFTIYILLFSLSYNNIKSREPKSELTESNSK